MQVQIYMLPYTLYFGYLFLRKCIQGDPFEDLTVAVSWCWPLECSGVTRDVREACWLGSRGSLNPELSLS